jgi:hypothetical protein
MRIRVQSDAFDILFWERITIVLCQIVVKQVCQEDLFRLPQQPSSTLIASPRRAAEFTSSQANANYFPPKNSNFITSYASSSRPNGEPSSKSPVPQAVRILVLMLENRQLQPSLHTLQPLNLFALLPSPAEKHTFFNR